ncbi:Ribosomal L18p/L5e family protein [Trifolium repens]|nr:Ribosomal L18p/L5e family protein [Trifolium repens]
MSFTSTFDEKNKEIFNKIVVLTYLDHILFLPVICESHFFQGYSLCFTKVSLTSFKDIPCVSQRIFLVFHKAQDTIPILRKRSRITATIFIIKDKFNSIVLKSIYHSPNLGLALQPFLFYFLIYIYMNTSSFSFIESLNFELPCQHLPYNNSCFCIAGPATLKGLLNVMFCGG